MTKKSSSKRMSMSEIRAKWKALGDKAKQKYIEKAKLSSEAYKEQKVEVDPQEESKETFTTRSQLKTACDIIRKLEPQQMESVKAMGFGAHKLPIKRLKWLPVQEPGSDDCGVHTAKYFDLEQFNEEEAAKLRFSSEEDRNSLILDLILCGENVIRNKVIRKAQEKYCNTRRII
ncbi:hypothetical protein RHSIM_Rhsim01G0048300 [Rhododendron simsii]|uniref:Uncharacterized protein n=1 Tax=Rhododendron simsii TaxID=118357 RepID=A0A834LVS8_RHOSS|nr:hypothetical protein RHSIM_Rhsim01G0048300 [Rhododendron simsii]